MSKNINQSLIKTYGSGKRFPLNKDESAQARALNRRAEIIIITKDTHVISNIDTTTWDTSSIDIKNIEIGSSFLIENFNFEPGRHKLLIK